MVDRDARFRASLLALVQNAGYEASGVECGDDAVTRALAEPPDVAIVAVELPGISGFEVCRRLRAALPGIGIILVSETRTESLDRATGLLIGADDYLARTFAPDELVASILALTRRVNGRPARCRRRRRSGPGSDGPRAASAGTAGRRCLAGGHRRDARHQRKDRGGPHRPHPPELGVHSRAQAVAVAYRDGHVTA